MSSDERAEQGKARTREAGEATFDGAEPADQGGAAAAERPAPPDDEGTIRVQTYYEEGRREPLFQGRAYTHGIEVGRCWATTSEGALAAVAVMLGEELARKEPGMPRVPARNKGGAKTRR